MRLESPLDAFAGGGVWADPARSDALFGRRRSNPTHTCGAPRTMHWHATFATDAGLPSLKLTRRGSSTYVVSLAADVENVTVRSFVSHTDADGAKANAEAEVPLEDAAIPSALDHRGLALHADLATHRWRAVLAAVAIAPAAVPLGYDGDGDARTRFYTALYHAHLGPTLLGDALDGGFKWGGRGFPFGRTRGGAMRLQHTQYSTFSLWDTYRAQNPLLNLLHPILARDIAESLLLKAEDAEAATEESLPKWQLFGMETFCMSGYPSAIVLADAILKNATNHGRGAAADGVPERALRQMARTGNAEPHVNASRWIPDSRHKSVSHALEVAVADACVARVADRLGDAATAAAYAARSRAYRSYWDVAQNLFAGRLENGSFVPPAGGVPKRADRPTAPDAARRSAQVRARRPEAYDASGRFEEGSPLQYSLMVPHDAAGLVELYGGKAALRERLRRYFFGATLSFEDGEDAPVDLATGYVGKHCQGNEDRVSFHHFISYAFHRQRTGAPRPVAIQRRRRSVARAARDRRGPAPVLGRRERAPG